MSLASANAKNLLKKFNIKSLANIDIEELCLAENLFIKTKENLKCEGRIVFTNDTGIITIEKNIKEITHKRFIIAHEMGHYYNERHLADSKNLFYNCTGENFFGLSGINKNKNELNASSFADELLLPDEELKTICKKRRFSFKLITEICSAFNVSLSTASFRLEQLNVFPSAIIMTCNQYVKWVKISAGFKYKFIQVGMKVNSLSYAYDFYNKKPIPNAEDIPAEAWFKRDYTFCDRNERIMEMVIPMPRYNSAMVLLYEMIQ